ncbi:membrane protein [Candidatus Magnetobacterium bavaricum]|uniref:Membrane protein n=1 Tax=Candidatus Magnetobacterium bavaricum TaxID=29290 RepID=A0A0F3GTL4_9BACT|nr:membrane protein [Candidatus Magnetobacterium bavaricum]
MMLTLKGCGGYIQVFMLMFFLTMIVKPVDLSLTINKDMAISFTVDVCSVSNTTVLSSTEMPFVNECPYFLIIMPLCAFIALEKVFRYLIITFPIEHPPDS